MGRMTIIPFAPQSELDRAWDEIARLRQLRTEMELRLYRLERFWLVRLLRYLS